MNIEIRNRETETSESLNRHIQRKLERAVGVFSDRIESVVVRLHDLNGPRAGIDKQCNMEATVGGAKLASHATSDDWFVSVTRAAARLARAVGKLASRRRRSERRFRPAGTPHHP